MKQIKILLFFYLLILISCQNNANNQGTSNNQNQQEAPARSLLDNFSGTWTSSEGHTMSITKVADGHFEVNTSYFDGGFKKLFTINDKGSLVGRNHWGETELIFDQNGGLISTNAMYGTSHWHK